MPTTIGTAGSPPIQAPATRRALRPWARESVQVGSSLRNTENRPAASTNPTIDPTAIRQCWLRPAAMRTATSEPPVPTAATERGERTSAVLDAGDRDDRGREPAVPDRDRRAVPAPGDEGKGAPGDELHHHVARRDGLVTHPWHLPRSAIHDATGTFSHHCSSRRQVGQKERGATTERPCGDSVDDHVQERTDEESDDARPRGWQPQFGRPRRPAPLYSTTRLMAIRGTIGGGSANDRIFPSTWLAPRTLTCSFTDGGSHARHQGSRTVTEP